MEYFADYEGKRKTNNPWNGGLYWAKKATVDAFRPVFETQFPHINKLRRWGPVGTGAAIETAARQFASNYSTEQSTTIFRLIMGCAIRHMMVQFEPIELATPPKLPFVYNTLDGFGVDRFEVRYSCLP